AVVLLLRAHYTMDVFAGVMTALYVATIAAWLAVPCDRALTHAFAGRSSEVPTQGPDQRPAARRYLPRDPLQFGWEQFPVGGMGRIKGPEEIITRVLFRSRLVFRLPLLEQCRKQSRSLCWGQMFVQ